jgi:ATP-dependent Lon protease
VILLTGPTTVANLFFNMATGKVGLVGIWDAVAFDEVADLQKMPKEVITTLKTYCESGSFARGKETVSGIASIAMFGNTNQPVDVLVRSSHLFAPMPDVIRDDMAFLDRLHFYLPGWEIPKMRNEFFTDGFGFVIDYLAEALKELRKQNYTEVLDRHFSLGSHLNARDVKAVRKSVSGLVKLIYPHEQFSRAELAELVDLAVEGRRRVKEQLKKMGSFEYHQTSFSYIDNETREERFVGVPEEGGRELISTDPLAPGSVYTAAVNDTGKVGLYRLEVGTSPGTGKLKVAGGVDGLMKESLQRSFAYLLGHKKEFGLSILIDSTDFHVEAIDLMGTHVPCEAGVAFFVAVYSALQKRAAQPALVILGDMSVQGNLKALRTLNEPLRIAMENGAHRALVPIENKRNLLDVPADVIDRVDPIFFSDPLTAAMKGLGLK